MVHHMKLHEQPFAHIACGQKTIELRLNDEKRQRIQIGDEIIFSMSSSPLSQIRVLVTALHRFTNFRELYSSLPLDRCGYLPHELPSASAKDMEKYYSSDEQHKYGVLGIEFKVIA